MGRARGAFIALAAGIGAAACSEPDFDPASRVASVRLLASQADAPFARPGEPVHVQVLAADGRAGPVAAPMRVFWLPAPCVNPAGDDYFACFDAYDVSRAGGGAGPGGIPLVAGADATPFLVDGPAFSFAMPSDAIASHATPLGAVAPYGIAFAFVVACAGHVALVPRDAANVQSSPFACFDAANAPVPPSDFAVGFASVFAYESLRNANPAIDGVTFGGRPVDAAAGVSPRRCTSATLADCPKTALDAVVPDGSDEASPLDLDAHGAPLREQIWVDYYATSGKLADDGRVLYDPVRGKLAEATTYQSPQQTATGTLWVVVHDNRGGASWLTFPLRVQ
jgi:hypothetical protein